MEFYGGLEARIDEKGRLKLPADLKRYVDETFGSPKFYVTSKDGVNADLYPLKAWKEVMEKLGKLGSMSPIRRKFMTRTNYFGQMAEMDTQGRILLPQVMRSELNLKDEVLVTSELDFLQVSNLAMLKANMKDDPMTAEDSAVIAGLGI